jgi:hypothetical protein
LLEVARRCSSRSTASRAWIVEHLNAMATRTSYGVTCADLLRKVRVPDPPEVAGVEDQVEVIARELYARDTDSTLRTQWVRREGFRAARDPCRR